MEIVGKVQLLSNYINIFDGTSWYPVDILSFTPEPKTVLSMRQEVPADIIMKKIHLPSGRDITVVKQISTPKGVLNNIRSFKNK